MDSRQTPARRQTGARLEVVEVPWRMRSLQKSTRILACCIYRTDAGLEVRCAYEPDDLLRSQTAPDIGTAQDIAEEWRQAAISKGGFEELHANRPTVLVLGAAASKPYHFPVMSQFD